MKIISVAGTSSEAGKTTVGVFIIKALRDVCALKVTVRHEGSCPRDKDTSCDGCSSEEESLFTVITDPAILSDPGKDTARYLQAGAQKVVWLQTNSECAREGIRKSLKMFDDRAIILIEGNRFIAIRRADLAVMVVPSDLKKVKRSALEIFEKVDLFVINRRPGIPEQAIAATKARLESMGGKSGIIVIDPGNPEPEARDALLARVRRAVKSPAGVAV